MCEVIVRLTRRLGNALDFILSLDSIAGVGVVSSVDDLISEALSDGLDVAESLVTGLEKWEE